MSLSTSWSDKFTPVREGKHFTSNLDTKMLSFIFTMFTQSGKSTITNLLEFVGALIAPLPE